MLTKDEINSFRQILQNEKAEIENHLQINDHFNLEKGHAHESVGELSSIDNHPADEGTELFEREKDVALNEHAMHYLKKIEKALQAIQLGSYGKCEVCGKEIPIDRLKAIPTTTYCVAHSPEKKVSENRPQEENVFHDPFSETPFFDRKKESVGYDAEDSWQEVAEWGTSETSSDFENFVEYNEGENIDPDENIGYVEDFENFIGTDIYGKQITIYPNRQHEKYEQALDEEGIMTTFGDLHPFEREPYVEDNE